MTLHLGLPYLQSLNLLSRTSLMQPHIIFDPFIQKLNSKIRLLSWTGLLSQTSQLSNQLQIDRQKDKNKIHNKNKIHFFAYNYDEWKNCHFTNWIHSSDF